MYIDNLGEELKYERCAWGMSKKRLARLANTDIETIELIESGELKNPDFYLLLKICDILEISIFTYLKDKHNL